MIQPMFGSLGFPELIFIFLLALLIFGPKKLPELGRTLGKAMAEFRKATTDLKRTINAELLEQEMRDADPRKIVRDSLREAKASLENAVRGDDARAAGTKAAAATAAATAVARKSAFDPSADPSDDDPAGDDPAGGEAASGQAASGDPASGGATATASAEAPAAVATGEAAAEAPDLPAGAVARGASLADDPDRDAAPNAPPPATIS